ncbi:MAG: M3 family metallopeptidase, partial [Wenzhouxiangella sp.]|nr:M3 family metallopeptidase [Wenzhouxiangella sp.]
VLDFEIHQLSADQVPGPDALADFEADILEKYEMDYAPVPPRYRPAYFSHSMGGYSAGYYSYFWAEVLDADSVLWIKENGGLDRATGDHFRNTILANGGSQDAMALYEQFAGRIPGIEPLLERRGLLESGD